MIVPRLGINIDHVATLRQARGESYPSLVGAAEMALENGADQITIHLREDRRHIQDTDVIAIALVTRKFGKPLNLEMGAAEDILNIAIEVAPSWICLVPEKREELTTEGGLNLLSDDIFSKLQGVCNQLKEKIKGVKISLFLEAREEILMRALDLRVDAVEIHTGEYATDFLNGEDISGHLSSFQKAKAFLDSKNIACHAGHGLTNKSVLPLLKSGGFEEYNIGHWVVSEAVFLGLARVVKDLRGVFDENC